MFTSPVSSTPSGPSAAPPNNPSSPPSSRTSRLRGLSYLRNYTHNHLLSRDQQVHNGHHPPVTGPSPNQTGAASAVPSSPASPSAASPTSSHFSRPRDNLIRSASYSGTSTSVPPNPGNDDANNSPSSAGHRLSLVASHHEPLRTTVTEPGPSSSSRSSSAPRDHRPIEGPSRDEPSTEDAPAPAAGGVPVVAHDSASAPTASASASASARDEGDDSSMTRSRAAAGGDAIPAPAPIGESLPSIRFSAYYDPRATRPSLSFPPVARTLPSGVEVIRVGRYSERDTQPNVPANTPSAAPVGFKSKVVSRRHCEFWYEQGKWYIKDVKSSSGTFLNHIRLSPPGTESKPFPVNDGDIVQLGIDFKGGEEMIFRCVKMRLELNRGWQNKLNAFNMNTHKRLRNMAFSSASTTSQDCSICLNSIAPCQSLFVAPCSHTWHFKCIRALLNSPQYPIFLCPNCRAATDLEADVEEAEEWQRMESDEGDHAESMHDDVAGPSKSASAASPLPTPPAAEPASGGTPSNNASSSSNSEGDAMDVSGSAGPPQSKSPAVGTPGRAQISLITNPLPIANTPASQTNGTRSTRTPSPPGQHLLNGNEGPITPRNDAGPWVFDGSAGMRAAAATAGMTAMGGMRSLDAATEMEVDG